MSLSLFALAIAAAMQTPSPLEGTWRANDGSATARIAPCAAGQGLCAAVIEERPAPGEPSSVGQVVVRNLRPDARGWRGDYHSSGQTFATNVKLLNANAMEVRVCVAPMLCDTVRYGRVAPR